MSEHDCGHDHFSDEAKYRELPDYLQNPWFLLEALAHLGVPISLNAAWEQMPQKDRLELMQELTGHLMAVAEFLMMRVARPSEEFASRFLTGYFTAANGSQGQAWGGETLISDDVLVTMAMRMRLYSVMTSRDSGPARQLRAATVAALSAAASASLALAGENAPTSQPEGVHQVLTEAAAHADNAAQLLQEVAKIEPIAAIWL